MPSSPGYKRNYKMEYLRYHKDEEQKTNRAKRNKARRMMEEDGIVHKGDGMDVDHKKALIKGGGAGKSNLRVVKKSSNRSFKRTKKAGMK